MSDTETKPKITSSVKEKNQGRVNAGKRLAALNKARNNRVKPHDDSDGDQQNQQDNKDQSQEWSSPIMILTTVGIVSGLVCLYFTYKQDKRSERVEQQTKTEDEPSRRRRDVSDHEPSPGNNVVIRMKSFD